MADTPDDIRAALEKQLADLRNEVTRLSASAAAQADKAAETARDYADDASEYADGTVKQFRQQAGAVAGAIRENPRTAATVLTSVALLGFALGLSVGSALAAPQRRYW